MKKSKSDKGILIFVVLLLLFQIYLYNDKSLVTFERDEQGHIIRPASSKTHYLSLSEFNDESEEAQEVYNRIKGTVDNVVAPGIWEAGEQMISVLYDREKSVQIINDIMGVDVEDYLNIED